MFTQLYDLWRPPPLSWICNTFGEWLKEVVLSVFETNPLSKMGVLVVCVKAIKFKPP